MKFRLLGETGVFVSELCLGAMTFGGEAGWNHIADVAQRDADVIVGRSLDAGVNFVDTADVYSAGQAERMLGKALGERRKDVVLATKVRGRMGKGPNQTGLSRLHILEAVNDSLSRLGTDYIDLYQVHRFDELTSLEDTLAALDDLVRTGKVRYIGCSNFAAWQIMKALGISRERRLARFCCTQSYYSLAGRELERDMIPLVKDQRLGLLVWSPLAGGFLTGKFTRDTQDAGGRRATFDFPPVDKDKGFAIVDVLRQVAEQRGVTIAQVALAWLLAKESVTSVIIGARTLEQLDDNLKSVDVTLAQEDVQRLDDVSKLTPEYPAWISLLRPDRRPGEFRWQEE